MTDRQPITEEPRVTRRPTARTAEQIGTAYRVMAKHARYRPAAPSDGLGTITAPLHTLDLAAEARTYARSWWAEEDDGEGFHVGFPDYEARPALIYLVEAARCLCGMDYTTAARLARMAADALDERATQRTRVAMRDRSTA